MGIYQNKGPTILLPPLYLFILEKDLRLMRNARATWGDVIIRSVARISSRCCEVPPFVLYVLKDLSKWEGIMGQGEEDKNV